MVDYPMPSLPDCFQEEAGTDCFGSDSLPETSMEFDDSHLLEDIFANDRPHPSTCPVDATTMDPSLQSMISSNPSDVSSEGSGCFAMPLTMPSDDEEASHSQPCAVSVDDAALAQSPMSYSSADSLPARHDPAESPTDISKQQYVLVRLDETGRYMRTANDSDMELLVKLLNATEAPAHASRSQSKTTPSNESSHQPSTRAAVVTAPPIALIPSSAGHSPPPAHSTGQRKPGGPCCHCGATESPQWRRGPCVKPVLCNACGTRYRRTNQLGVAIPSYLKDKSRHATLQTKKRSRDHLDSLLSKPTRLPVPAA